MKELIIREKCVAICANCHGMLGNSIFMKHKEKIFSRFLQNF